MEGKLNGKRKSLTNVTGRDGGQADRLQRQDSCFIFLFQFSLTFVFAAIASNPIGTGLANVQNQLLGINQKRRTTVVKLFQVKLYIVQPQCEWMLSIRYYPLAIQIVESKSTLGHFSSGRLSPAHTLKIYFCVCLRRHPAVDPSGGGQRAQSTKATVVTTRTVSEKL